LSEKFDGQAKRTYLKETPMASKAFEDIVEDFDFLEDWEERYRYVIEQGKWMQPLNDALKVPSTKVEGCASQVWLHPNIAAGKFTFDGDSDAVIVRGLIAVLRHLYNDLDVKDVMDVDAPVELSRLGLNDHLSSQRSNGLRAMIERIRQVASDNV
jgi:cysteine desulfuration protein SufE